MSTPDDVQHAGTYWVNADKSEFRLSNEDVQRAAARLSTIEAEQILGENCRLLSEAFWAASERADLLFQVLREEGWTPPNERVKAHLTTSTEAWVPYRLRWRHVLAGDVFMSQDNHPWMVTAIGWNDPGLLVSAVRGTKRTEGITVDPDEEISVLLPAAEADALVLARRELGARVVDRTV